MNLKEYRVRISYVFKNIYNWYLFFNFGYSILKVFEIRYKRGRVMIDTPFKYDSIADREHFFGRTEELEHLGNIVKHANNLLLYSKRRMGKTTLVENFLDRQKEYICLYADIFDIASKEDFAQELLKALSNYEKGDLKSIVKKLTSLLKRVRIEPTIDPNTLEYSVKPVVATLRFEEMMEDFFGAIEKLSKEKPMIIAIDEFQQIATIKDVKLDAMLRKHIQHRKRISYLFLGSKRHLLTSLFSYKAPLYDLAVHFELKPLKPTAIYDYARRYLDITKEDIDYIYEIGDGETKMILHTLHLLYIQNKHVTKETIDEAVQEILHAKDATLRMLFDTLSNNQKIALKIVGKHKSGIFSTEVLNAFRIKKQTLKSAIDALMKKELIDKEGSDYFIPDRAFELWVKSLD